MEIELLRSSGATEDQMAQMMHLMQMEKLPPELSMPDFSAAAAFPPVNWRPAGGYTCDDDQSGDAGDHESYNPYISGEKRRSMAAMREMIFRIAAMQPVHVDPESVKPPKRRNVRISKDPQSVAARHRRERISERIRILQRMVPGGTKMDTASMLDEAIHYVKFLKTQVQSLERAAINGAPPAAGGGVGFPVVLSAAGGGGGCFPAMKSYPAMGSGGFDQQHYYPSNAN